MIQCYTYLKIDIIITTRFFEDFSKSFNYIKYCKMNVYHISIDLCIFIMDKNNNSLEKNFCETLQVPLVLN